MSTSQSNTLKHEAIAWPTLAVTAACLLAWLGAIAACVTGALPLWMGAAVATLAAFMAFTPMHDASHQSVIPPRSPLRWLNGAVGRAAGLPLFAPFPAFRYLHLMHHKHTNEPDDDPDFWSGRGPRWALPLRWLTQDLHYYVVYARRMKEREHAEVLEVWGTLAAFVALAVGLALAGFGAEVLALWLLPSRLATAALAWGFDYLPHRPHTVPARQDRFAATAIHTNWWLTPLFLYQNYHLIHHLYPGVPFYRYIAVFKERREMLLAKGAQVKRLGQRASGSLGVTQTPNRASAVTGAMEPPNTSRSPSPS
jgi:beta-carotene hydroxylase